MVDLALVAGVSWGLGLLVVRTPDTAEMQDEMVTLFLGVSAVYSIICWRRWGATVGKFLLGMRVVKMADAGQVTWLQAGARWSGYALSSFLFGAGFLMAAFHPRKRALHDLVSRTRVIRGRS